MGTMQVTDANFQDTVEGNDLVLIDFWAPWCGPCRALAPVLEEVADENSNLVVAKMNTDENPDTATQHGIMSIPTMMIFKKGQLVDRLVGALSKPQIMEKLEPHFDPDESSEGLSKNCEHCGFLNSAHNNPGWAGLLTPELADFFEGTTGCDISCISCGRNFWVSTKELTGSGPDVQFDSMPGVGDYMVNKMNKMAEESGDPVRYELPTEAAERKNRKETSKSEK